METDASSELGNSEKDDSSDSEESEISEKIIVTDYSIVKKIFNRQLYGRFTRNPKGKTDKIFNSIPDRCCYNFTEVIPLNADTVQQIFMGFTQCGRFLLSYTVEHSFQLTVSRSRFVLSPRYILHVWSFVPNKPAKHVADYRIFRHYSSLVFDIDITLCQWPTDLEKLVAYGTCQSYQSEAYLTIITLPSMQRCKDCTAESTIRSEDPFVPLTTSQCLKHGVTVDAMLSIMSPYPKFRPNISLAYPNYLILNTGHYLYALYVSLDNNLANSVECRSAKLLHKTSSLASLVTTATTSEITNFPDNVSDISESVSMKQELEYPNPNTGSDLSDCETEYSEYSKPFHELNISCEPLNVTGRSYWTSASVVSEPPTSSTKSTARVKMFLHKKELPKSTSTGGSATQTQDMTRSKIAEKAYEFIDETEKFEKLSLFRKKRLAEKKYEFSEDNCENIVPFNLLRYERRFCGKGTMSAQTSKNLIRSTNMSPIDCSGNGAGPFLSPRSSGLNSPRSPILSPSTRNGPFSPSGSRNNVYSRLVSPSPTSRKSPLSPRSNEITQKFNIYSPSHIDSSDYSDNDSKLVLRQINNISSSNVADISSQLDNRIKRDSSLERFSLNSGACGSSNEGLLIVDEKAKVGCFSKESFQWIKEIIRRYSAVDFESASSLVSDGQRDDYVSVELPVLVHTSGLGGQEHHLDAVPSHMSDDITGPGITLIHRTFDAEQFCHRTAKRICAENELRFIFCADYDINIIDICPISGDVICSAHIEVGAENILGHTQPASRLFYLRFIFVWGAGKPGGDHCIILDSQITPESRPLFQKPPLTPAELIRPFIQRHELQKIRVMDHNADFSRSVRHLCDEENLIKIVLDTQENSEVFY